MANMNTHGSESESILEEYATPLQYGCADMCMPIPEVISPPVMCMREQHLLPQLFVETSH